MSDTLKTIKATCGRNKYKLTLTSKNTLKLSDLKNVISNATGLSYQEEDGDDIVSVVPMIDGELIIDPRIDILYTILIDTPMHPLANFNASKSRKLMEIVKELAPPPPPPSAENSSDSDDSSMGPPKKIRKMITKNKAPCGKKIVKKYIMMRWIHYFFDSKKPYPRNNSNNQSSIKLELIESKEYNVAYIREAGLKFFNDSYTNRVFLESTIELGDWDKKIVKDFVINGHTCGLFQYLKYHKMQPSRTTLYIMTFEKTGTTTSQMMKEIQDLPCYPGSSNFNNQSA